MGFPRHKLGRPKGKLGNPKTKMGNPEWLDGKPQWGVRQKSEDTMEDFTLTRGGETLRVLILNAPPVYDPGGPVCAIEEWAGDEELLADAEREAAKRGAVLARVVSQEGDRAREAVLERRGYTVASEWYAAPTASEGTDFPGLRRAVAADVPRLLELGEAKRREYQTYSPTFWRISATPRETFTPFLTGQIENPAHVALVHDGSGQVDGFLIANADGYVDDYAVASPELWPTVGAGLLSATSREMRRRDVKNLLVVCGRGDGPKRTTLMSLGFRNMRNWFVRDLTPL